MSTERIRVAVVDDDAGSAEVLAQLLELEGFEADAFSNATDALSHSASLDIVVTDLHLGDESGIALCRALLARRSDLIVIVMSGSGENEHNATAAGARTFLLKPIDHDDLAAPIRGLIDDAHATR